MKTFIIKTFGCQMNEADSEKIARVFRVQGYQLANSFKEANVVIINTCSVRQSAEDRVLGLVNNLKKLKIVPAKPSMLSKTGKNFKPARPAGGLKIILTGCMLRYPLPYLKKILPDVDEFIKLKDLLAESTISNQQSAINNHSAYITIMEGCDNYCTYCVVPYSRGREVSRSLEEIYCEICELVRRGVKEITLLGQNVNSYGNSNEPNKANKSQFAKLLRKLHKIKGLKKISFLTSNPQDLSDNIIKAMKLSKIDRYLHLPVQSGDDEILKKMNRRYTVKQYLNLINKIRKQIPNIEIGTDIIVGFPGETINQFQHTVNLCKQVNFKLAYINKYSPRSGTIAYKLKDDIPWQEKKRRWKVLEKLINKKI